MNRWMKKGSKRKRERERERERDEEEDIVISKKTVIKA